MTSRSASWWFPTAPWCRAEILDAQEVEISGALTGLVRAREITLKATARVVGDLHHEVLAIDPGAQLEGQCRRLVPENQARSKSQRTEIPMP